MFNNGYNSFSPYQRLGYRQGLFSSLKGKFNWSTLLNNTQKTLSIINQAIPVFYQIKPVWNNTKTIFKIMGALKEDDKVNSSSSAIKKNNNNYSNNHINNQTTSISNYQNDNIPSFFL